MIRDPTRRSRWWGTPRGWKSSPALLLGGSVSGLRIAFPKSGVMGIDLEKLEPGAGELRFFLRPGMAEKKWSLYSLCPKIAMFDEWPGLTFALGLMKCTALFTAVHASPAPVAMSLSFPG